MTLQKHNVLTLAWMILLGKIFFWNFCTKMGQNAPNMRFFISVFMKKWHLELLWLFSMMVQYHKYFRNQVNFGDKSCSDFFEQKEAKIEFFEFYNNIINTWTWFKQFFMALQLLLLFYEEKPVFGFCLIPVISSELKLSLLLFKRNT